MVREVHSSRRRPRRRTTIRCLERLCDARTSRLRTLRSQICGHALATLSLGVRWYAVRSPALDQCRPKQDGSGVRGWHREPGFSGLHLPVRPPVPCSSPAGPGWARQGTSRLAPAAADRAGLGATAAWAQRRLDPPGLEHHAPRAQRAGDHGCLPAKRIGGTGAGDTAVTTSSALRACHFASGRTPTTVTKAVSLFRGLCEP